LIEHSSKPNQDQLSMLLHLTSTVLAPMHDFIFPVQVVTTRLEACSENFPSEFCGVCHVSYAAHFSSDCHLKATQAFLHSTRHLACLSSSVVFSVLFSIQTHRVNKSNWEQKNGEELTYSTVIYSVNASVWRGRDGVSLTLNVKGNLALSCVRARLNMNTLPVLHFPTTVCVQRIDVKIIVIACLPTN
jgi:hypothetical protein